MRRSRKYFFAVLLPIVLTIGCSTSDNEPGVSVSFTVLNSGSFLGGTAGDTKVLESYRNQADYDSAVNTYSLRVDGEVIDFTANQVVLISMGNRNSGGFTIAAESVRDAGDYIEMTVILSSPGTDCITTDAITHPYQLLKIDSLKEVRTNERNVIENCG